AGLVHQPEIEFGRPTRPKFTKRFVVLCIHSVARNGHVDPGHSALRAGHDGVRKLHGAAETLRLDDMLVSGIAVAKVDTDLDPFRNEIDVSAYAARSPLELVRIVKRVPSVVADDLHDRIPLQRQ